MCKFFLLHFQSKQLKFHSAEVMSAFDEWSMQYTLDKYYINVTHRMFCCRLLDLIAKGFWYLFKQTNANENEQNFGVLWKWLKVSDNEWELHVYWLLICVAFRITCFNCTSTFAYACHSAVCIVSAPFASVHSSISAHFKKCKVHSGTC